ncbi:unnamed protein product, partial [Chrysoparadoxa australica]
MRTHASLLILSLAKASQAFISIPVRGLTSTGGQGCMRMGIYDEIVGGVKEAMKAKQSAKLQALRGIKAAFLTEIKKTPTDDPTAAPTLSDEDCQRVLTKLGKMRRESIEMFEKGGRMELVAQEQLELDIIEAYLPKLADEETVTQWAKEAIAASGATGPSEMGKAMGLLMKAHKSDMDGKMVPALFYALLTSWLKPLMIELVAILILLSGTRHHEKLTQLCMSSAALCRRGAQRCVLLAFTHAVSSACPLMRNKRVGTKRNRAQETIET